ncbi:hypothetical protein OROMI_016050 [Orobanche minor]
MSQDEAFLDISISDPEERMIALRRKLEKIDDMLYVEAARRLVEDSTMMVALEDDYSGGKLQKDDMLYVEAARRLVEDSTMMVALEDDYSGGKLQNEEDRVVLPPRDIQARVQIL